MVLKFAPNLSAAGRFRPPPKTGGMLTVLRSIFHSRGQPSIGRVHGFAIEAKHQSDSSEDNSAINRRQSPSFIANQYGVQSTSSRVSPFPRYSCQPVSYVPNKSFVDFSHWKRFPLWHRPRL
jgi:hypothetical protein